VSDAAAKYYPQVKGFIRSRVGSAEDAEDIVQEVFYQYSKLDELLNPIGNVGAWLYRVARNKIIDRGRKKREDSLATDWEGEVLGGLGELLSGEGQSPEDDYMSALLWERLDEALAELPPAQREVFELTELQGLSIKEIAARMGEKPATLLSRKHYAVLHLRERLEDIYLDLVDY
jgi:RNA polymerase sigma factor (sigma-70 family)